MGKVKPAILLLTTCFAIVPPLRAQSSNCLCSGYNSSRTYSGWSFVDGDAFRRARTNLTDPANFGPAGVVARGVTIASGTGVATDATLAGIDVFFTGSTPTVSYGPAERSVIRNAVLNGMNLVITSDDADYNIADLFDVTIGGEAAEMNAPAVPDHPIFAGPFGRIHEYRSAVRYSTFRSWDSNARLLAASYSKTSIPQNGATMLLIPRRTLSGTAGAVVFLGNTHQLSTEGRSLNPNDSEPSVPVTDALVMNLVAFLCNPTAPAVAPHLVFPQIANGQGTISSINLTNSDPTNLTTGTVSFRGDDGLPYSLNIVDRGPAATFQQTIQSNETVALFTDGVGPLRSGTATVFGSTPYLGGNIIYYTPGQGATSVGATRMAGGFVLPVVPQPGPTPPPGSGVSIEVYSGVAICNLSAKTATIRLELWDRTGRRNDATRPITLPARGHRASYLFQLYEGLDLRGFAGTMRVVSRDGLIAVTALQLGSSSGPLAAGQFTSLPVTPIYR